MEDVSKEHAPLNNSGSGDEGVSNTSGSLVKSSSGGISNIDHKTKSRDDGAVVSKDVARIMKKLLNASNDGVIKSDMKTLGLVYKLDRMKYKHKQELSELKANYKNKEQKQKEQQALNDQVRKELVNLYNEFSCGVKMVGSLKDEIEQLRGQLSSSHQTTEDKVSVFRNQYDKETQELKEKQQSELERLAKEHSFAVEKLRAEHEHRLREEDVKQQDNTRELGEQHSADLRHALEKLSAELAIKHAEEMGRMNQEHQEVEAQHAKDFEVSKLSQSEQVTVLREEIELLKQKHADHVVSLKQQEEQLKQQHITDLAQQDQVHRNNIAVNSDAHAKQVEVLISTQQLYQKEIERLKVDMKEFEEKSKKEYDDMVENMNKKHSDEKEAVVGHHASEFEKYKRHMEDHVEQLTEENRRQVSELTENNAKDSSDWEEKFQHQEEAHTKAIATLHLDYQAQIAAMEQVLSNLKNEWESNKVTTQKEQELNTASNLQMILSLNNQRTHEIHQMQESYDSQIQQYAEKQKELISTIRSLKEENLALKKKHPCLHDHGHGHNHHHGSSNSRPSSPAGRPGSPIARPGSPAARPRSPSVGSPARPGSPSVRPSSPKTPAQRSVITHTHTH